MATRTKWADKILLDLLSTPHHKQQQGRKSGEERALTHVGTVDFGDLNKTPEVRDMLGRVLLHASTFFFAPWCHDVCFQKMRWFENLRNYIF